ncbi:hypothetical protein DFH06DRAFT_1330332 [Mycena polygramma]|nr:hypothetical protein DFH06DRAFT_1330332 [Mycena polygramma]
MLHPAEALDGPSISKGGRTGVPEGVVGVGEASTRTVDLVSLDEDDSNLEGCSGDGSADRRYTLGSRRCDCAAVETAWEVGQVRIVLVPISIVVSIVASSAARRVPSRAHGDPGPDIPMHAGIKRARRSSILLLLSPTLISPTATFWDLVFDLSASGSARFIDLTLFALQDLCFFSQMPSYALRVHSCEEVVWSRRKAPNLYVVIYQDGRAIHRTNAVKRNRTPEWDDLCNLSLESTITLRLWHDCLLRCRDICLGAVDTEISALLNPASSDTEYIRLPLTSEDRGSGKHTGTVLVCLVHDGAAASMAIEQSKQSIGQLAHVSALMEAAGMVDSSQPAVKTFEAGLGIIITKLDMIIQIGNEVAKIHPYANMAWKVLTSVYQAVKAEQETQEKLRKLVDNMVSVYSFAEETDALPQKIKSLEDKVLAIVKQTVECAVLIREYSGHGFTGMHICRIRSTA